MPSPHVLAVRARVALLLPALAFMSAPSASAQSAAAANPLLDRSPLPFEYPPFNLITNEHFLPAFERGMTEELAEVEAIATNSAPATFENTIVALERSGQLLSRVSSVFQNLDAANTNPELQKIQRSMAPRIAAHTDAIQLNPKLFARISSLYEARDKLGLDAESKRLLWRYHQDFVRAGAKLGESEKERLKTLNSELASLSPARWRKSARRWRNTSRMCRISSSRSRTANCSCSRRATASGPRWRR